jgi:hypothetical protein
MSRLPAVFAVEERSGKRPIPTWKYCLRELSELRILASFFPVIGKHRLIAGQKTPHQDQVAIVIHAHAHDSQPLRRVLFRQFIKHRVLVAAGFAISRPEIDEQRLPAILLEQFLIGLRVNQLWIARGCRLRGLRCRHGRRRSQQTKHDNASLDSHGPSFCSHSIRTPAG